MISIRRNWRVRSTDVRYECDECGVGQMYQICDSIDADIGIAEALGASAAKASIDGWSVPRIATHNCPECSKP